MRACSKPSAIVTGPAHRTWLEVARETRRVYAEVGIRRQAEFRRHWAGHRRHDRSRAEGDPEGARHLRSRRSAALGSAAENSRNASRAATWARRATWGMAVAAGFAVDDRDLAARRQDLHERLPTVSVTGLPLASRKIVGARTFFFDQVPLIVRPLVEIQAGPLPTTVASSRSLAGCPSFSGPKCISITTTFFGATRLLLAASIWGLPPLTERRYVFVVRS